MKHSITFTLRPSTGLSTSPIRARVSFNGTRVDINTGLSCPPSDWQDGRCISRQRTRWRESAATINARLASISSAIDTLFIECDLVPRFPTSDEIRSAFASVASAWLPISATSSIKKKGQPSPADPSSLNPHATGSLLSLLDLFITTSSDLYGWSDGTIRKWRTIRNLLASYDANLNSSTLTSSDLESFLLYLRRRGSRNTTIAKHAKNLRWFLRWCVKRGHLSPSILTDFTPTIKGTDPSLRDIVYLELDELLYLYDLPIPSTKPGLAAARDIFCFCCFTGLRYSDAQRLRRHHIGPDAIRLVTKKDTDPITIQLNDYSRSILSRYASANLPDHRVLPALSNQKANDHLKTLGALAGLCRRFRHVYFVGSQRHESHPQLREILTTHCARRTFVVTALRLGIPTTIIRSWTGHSTDATLRPYYHIVTSAQSSSMSLFNTISTPYTFPSNPNKENPET